MYRSRFVLPALATSSGPPRALPHILSVSGITTVGAAVLSHVAGPRQALGEDGHEEREGHV